VDRAQADDARAAVHRLDLRDPPLHLPVRGIGEDRAALGGGVLLDGAEQVAIAGLVEGVELLEDAGLVDVQRAHGDLHARQSTTR
jgi:hypothetical protein